MNKKFIDLEQFFNSKHITKESAYILGLMWADGNINSKRYSVTVTCVRSDLEQLNHIFKKTGDWKIYYRQQTKNRQPQQTFYFGSKVFAQKLEEFDYKNKSVVSANRVLSIIPDELKHYWWRGFSDGDGCFYSNKNYQFFFTGSLNQDWDFVENVWKQLDINYTLSKSLSDRGNCSRAKISNKSGIIKFGEYIYRDYLDDRIGFKRKYVAFQEYYKTYPRKPVGSGVYLHKPSHTWCARIKVAGKNIYLGYYKNKQKAENIVLQKRKELGIIE